MSAAESEVLDLRGLKCPLPALFTKKRLQRAAPGETIVVLADDPLAAIDIPHMCTQEGFEHMATAAESGHARIAVRRSRDRSGFEGESAGEDPRLS